MKFLLFFILISVATHLSTAQVYRDTILSVKAGDANSGSTSSTPGETATTFGVGRYPPKGGTGSYTTKRTFVECNLSSIPSNAIITEAKLKLYINSTGASSPSIRTARVNQFWFESSLSWSNQPTYLTSDQVTSSSVSSSWLTIDVTSHCQKMTAGVYSNLGWVLYHVNELQNVDINYNFRSDEYSGDTYDPRLEISYYIPMSVSSADIFHQSSTGSNDGSILPTLQDGPGGTLSYQWYNSSGSMSGKTALLLSGIPYGWYGLKVTSTTSGSIPFYYSFLVGKKCETVTIDYNPGPDFVDDASINNHVNSIENNGGNALKINAETWTNSTWFEARSLLKFRLWLDSKVIVDSAKLHLFGEAHNPLQRSNDAELVQITEDWNELITTYSSIPTYSTGILTDVPATSSSTQNAVLNVLNFWNFWKGNNENNFGFMFKLDTYATQYTRQQYYSSDYTTAGNRPKMVFNIQVEPQDPVITFWDPIGESGVININLDELCESLTGPYHYVVSDLPIPTLDDTYTTLHDSVGFVGIDSSSLFVPVVSTFNEFRGLNPGNYYVSVFDSNWDRILDTNVQVQPDLVLKNEIGLTSNNDIINSSQANAYGELDLFGFDDSNSEIEYTLSNLSGNQYLGYMNVTDTAVSFNANILKYGFKLSNQSVSTVYEGSVYGTPFSITASDRLVLEIRDRQVYYRLNDSVISTKSIDSLTGLKSTIGLQSSEVLKAKIKGKIVLIKLPSYTLYREVTRNFKCDGTTGRFKFKISPMFLQLGGPNTATYNVYDPNNILVKTGTTNFTNYVNVNVYSNSDPLIPGVYTISGLINGTTAFSGQIRLGYETSWNQVVGYNQSPNDYSLEHIESNNTYSFARSNNAINSDVDGWIEFTVKSTGINVFRPSTLSTQIDPLNVLNTEDYVAFIWWNGLAYAAKGYNNTGVYAENMGNILNPRVRLEFTGTPSLGYPDGKIDVYVNNILKTSIAKGNSTILSKCNSIIQNDGFENIISSFGCRSTENIYAKLKYELDGYYHIMKGGKIKFQYIQEYEEGELQFKIYNGRDELVKTNSDYPAINPTFGDNYLTIDVAPNGQCIGKGFFYLEITNAKKEKFYLRFYNDYSSIYCIEEVLEEF